MEQSLNDGALEDLKVNGEQEKNETIDKLAELVLNSSRCLTSS
jgi:hypothetical protein